MVTIGDPYAEIAAVSDWWKCTDERDRKEACEIAAYEADAAVQVISASAQGRVILSVPDNTAAETGVAVRLVQAAIQEHVEPGLRCYLEVKGDMNSLRRLRGVEIDA